MGAELTADLVDKGIMFGAGILATYLGFVNTNPRYRRFRTFFRVGGPALMIIAILLFVAEATRGK